MTKNRLLEMNDKVVPGTKAKVYANLVNNKVRERYSVSDELAILRQRDTKPEEFAAYNDFVEQCKAEVKSELGI